MFYKTFFNDTKIMCDNMLGFVFKILYVVVLFYKKNKLNKTIDTNN